MSWKSALDMFVPPIFALVGIMIWPTLVLALAMMFRSQIGNLINRIASGELWGAKITAPPPTQTVREIKAIGENVKGLGKGPALAEDNPLQGLAEESIQQNPVLKNLDCESQLAIVIQAHAALQMQVTFERTYRLIFGSQLAALRAADRNGGIPIEDIRAIFNRAKANFSELHKDRTFEQWAQFLIDTGLAMAQDGQRTAVTTMRGHEFHAYVAQMRYPEPYG